GGPLLRYARRQVLAEAQARRGEITEDVRDRVERKMGRRPHPELSEWRPVAPVAALRADDERAAHAMKVRQKTQGLAAEAVSDDERIAGQVLEGSGRIQECPVAHARFHFSQVAVLRAADAAVVES